MTESLPSLITLSSLQRQVLELIVLKGTSIQGQAWREQIILLWEQGMSISETAQELEIDVITVHRLRQKWLSSAEGLAKAEKKVHDATVAMVSEVAQILESGKDRPKSTLTSTATVPRKKRKKQMEPPQELSPAARALIEIVHNKPRVYGINRSTWTLRSVAKAFEQQYGQSISHTSVSNYLKEAGYGWKKSRKVLMSPDPNYREKVELLLKTLQSLKADEMFFFIDELGPMQVKRYGGRCYTPKGQTPTHPQNPRSKGSITIYGALSATTNQMTWFYGHTKDSAGMIDLVEILFNQYHEKSRIYITWDAASWHGANKLVEWADDLNRNTKANGTGPIIEFVPLPSSAQFLNVIEAVFSGMKRAVIHFSDYQTPEEMKEAISRHFRERNEFFRDNPKRAGNKIWEVDFFYNHNNILSGNYREW
jgi:transposase